MASTSSLSSVEDDKRALRFLAKTGSAKRRLLYSSIRDQSTLAMSSDMDCAEIARFNLVEEHDGEDETKSGDCRTTTTTTTAITHPNVAIGLSASKSIKQGQVITTFPPTHIFASVEPRLDLTRVDTLSRVDTDASALTLPFFNLAASFQKVEIDNVVFMSDSIRTSPAIVWNDSLSDDENIGRGSIKHHYNEFGSRDDLFGANSSYFGQYANEGGLVFAIQRKIDAFVENHTEQVRTRSRSNKKRRQQQQQQKEPSPSSFISEATFASTPPAREIGPTTTTTKHVAITPTPLAIDNIAREYLKIIGNDSVNAVLCFRPEFALPVLVATKSIPKGAPIVRQLGLDQWVAIRAIAKGMDFASIQKMVETIKARAASPHYVESLATTTTTSNNK